MLRYAIALLLSLTVALPAAAEQVQKVGKYAVHHVAFGSTFLTPEIARTYDITRSRYVGLVNITVIDTSLPGDETHAVAVKIQGTARNLLGNVKNLSFKEIREGTAIYYIAEVGHRNEETFTFDIEVSNGQDLSTELTFKQKFFVD
ncbi:DUF4426 domain-containing protein [Ferrimonas balearica]|uniref:DUF4426 domain-containing protein n=1 Tax=Ferrimonas balearica TaxID=44012 RepID=UPI001C99684F|nr:DUF4426 domain-containing protein [Ferrimonas balearica]MBY5921802.1 DUF4426 domain-containing protein [Ferrimonas balearica]MBY5994858.1 DUF4426 domain-containing protein [Ferrimonas balearica]